MFQHSILKTAFKLKQMTSTLDFVCVCVCVGGGFHQRPFTQNGVLHWKTCIVSSEMEKSKILVGVCKISGDILTWVLHF